MTLNGAIPFKSLLHKQLEDSTFASQFLRSALDDESEFPGALFAATKEVLEAWALTNFREACIALVVLSQFLSAEELSQGVDLLEELATPQERAFFADHGVFTGLRYFVQIKANGGTLVLESIEKGVSGPPPQGIKNALGSIQGVGDFQADPRYQMLAKTLISA